MTCTVIVNRDSGNCNKLNINSLLEKLQCTDAQVVNIDKTTDWSADDADTVIICGGDGTLHNAIEKYPNKQLVYAPCGTLNETALTEHILTSVGRVNDKLFSYVCATGSFTEIGYCASDKSKQRFKRVAYLPQVLRCYKSHQIHATLNVDDRTFTDDYTLLMVLKSHRCFGFEFNSAYKRNKGLYLLAIKSFGKDCLLNRAKMFFPFFRVFFVGAKPSVNDRWLLLPFHKLTIDLDGPHDFCMDGEQRTFCGKLEISEQQLAHPIPILNAPNLKK